MPPRRARECPGHLTGLVVGGGAAARKARHNGTAPGFGQIRSGFAASAAGLTLLSGAVMVFAGYIGDTECWAWAALITIPGGVLIAAAFVFARRAGPDRGRASGSRPPAATVAATLLSGGVMVFAGYAGSAWGWALALPLATVGGLVIAVAFVLDARRLA